MRQLLITLTIVTMTTINSVTAQNLDFAKVKSIEHQLDDVMEVIDTSALKLKLIEVEESYKVNPSEMNKSRLGIIYHETALNLSFFQKQIIKDTQEKVLMY
jgi:hypothetical protein